MASPDLTTIFKALSDANRLAIFQLVRRRCREGTRIRREQTGESVSRIAEEFDLALSTVSHHLKELKRAGLIKCEKRGQWVYCSPDEGVLARVGAFLEDR